MLALIIKVIIFDWILGLANLLILMITVHLINEHFKFTTYYVIGVFIATIHYLNSVPWVIGQWMNVFHAPGLITTLGSILRVDLVLLAYFLMFFSILVDLTFLLIFAWLIKIFWVRTPQIKNGLESINNIITKSRVITLKNIKFRQIKIKKIKLKTTFLLFILLFALPMTYLSSLNAIEETSEGVRLILEGIKEISKITGPNGLNANQFLSNPAEQFKIENSLFSATQFFEKARENLNALNYIGFYPILLLTGLNDDIPYIYQLLENLSQLTGISFPDLIKDISNYLEHLTLLITGVIDRGIWWELSDEYNAKTNFFDKFNYNLIDEINQSSLLFKKLVLKIEESLSRTFLDANNNVQTLLTTLNNFKDQIIQIFELSRVGFPLLNATFASVAVTDQLAHDNFVTARQLTDESEQYVLLAQSMLASLQENDNLFNTVNDLSLIMKQLNKINQEFINMTNSAEEMFLNINKSISLLERTSYNAFIPSQTEIQDLNIVINQSNFMLSQIINRSVDFIDINLNQDYSAIIFPFRDIFRHFEWFFDGYFSAVIGYNNFWLTSNSTISLFREMKNLKDIFSFELNLTRQLGVIPAGFVLFPLYELIGNFDTQIKQTSILLAQSVTDGAINTNKTNWSFLLGYNKSVKLNSGFQQIINEMENFLDRSSLFLPNNVTGYYNELDNLELLLEGQLNSLTGSEIYLGIKAGSMENH